MKSRRFTWALVTVGLSLGAAGCAGAPHDDASAGQTEEGLTTSQLRNLAHVQGLLEGRGETELHYEPTKREYDEPIAFEAVEVTDVDGDAHVEVTGAFPGRGRVLVVDSQFHVVASGWTKPEEGAGLQIQTNDRLVMQTARVPVSVGNMEKVKILVRDTSWDRPMSFNVAVR